MFSARRCLSSQPLRPVVSSAVRPRLLRQYAQKRTPSELASLLPQSSSLTDFRMRIMSAANLGNANDCLRLAAAMKEANLVPDASTYNAILSVLAKNKLHQFAWAVLEDMRKMGIPPDATAYAHFIQVSVAMESGMLMLMKSVACLARWRTALSSTIGAQVLRRATNGVSVLRYYQRFSLREERRRSLATLFSDAVPQHDTGISCCAKPHSLARRITPTSARVGHCKFFREGDTTEN